MAMKIAEMVELLKAILEILDKIYHATIGDNDNDNKDN